MDGLLGEDEEEDEEEFLQPYIVSNPHNAMDGWMDSNSWREVIHTSAR